MLTKEQSENIKQQLVQQIQVAYPHENKELIMSQIQSMTSEQLENFLIQNNLIKQDGVESSSKKQKTTECIFCSIINNEIPCYKIDENKDAVAILEINPLTKGHSLIIPKKHTTLTNIPSSALTLAKKIAKKLKDKIKPKPEEVKIETASLMNHAVINIIPLYKDFPPKKYKAEERELLELQKILEKKIKPQIVKIPQIKELKQNIRLPKRIP